MSLIIIFSFILLSSLLLFFRKKLWGSVVLGLTLLLTLSIWSGFTTQLALSQMQPHPRLSAPVWKANNLIVVLGFGSVRWDADDHISSQSLDYSRLIETARLYHDCKLQPVVCKILISGGDPAGLGVAEADTMARELAETGVNSTDLIIENKSRNTFQNASFSAALIAKDYYDRIVLVTSGTHMTRALKFFDFFGVQPLPAPSSHLSPRRSFSVASINFFLLDVALHEALGIAQFHYYNFMGWNQKK